MKNTDNPRATLKYQLLTCKWPLSFVLRYIQPISQHYKRRTVGEAVTMENMDNSCREAITLATVI